MVVNDGRIWHLRYPSQYSLLCNGMTGVITEHQYHAPPPMRTCAKCCSIYKFRVYNQIAKRWRRFP